jgi:hypothetical protein
VKILVEPGERFTVVAGKAPAVGRHYVMEEAETATAEQGRAYHALAQEFWRSGLHSYEVNNFDDFRDFLKRDLGAGFERFVYIDMVDGLAVLKDAKTMADIPEHVRRDPKLRMLARGRLKSWADYTRKERTEAIDRLISTMRQAGVQSAKFDEILSGMGALDDHR